MEPRGGIRIRARSRSGSGSVPRSMLRPPRAKPPWRLLLDRFASAGLDDYEYGMVGWVNRVYDIVDEYAGESATWVDTVELVDQARMEEESNFRTTLRALRSAEFYDAQRRLSTIMGEYLDSQPNGPDSGLGGSTSATGMEKQLEFTFGNRSVRITILNELSAKPVIQFLLTYRSNGSRKNIDVLGFSISEDGMATVLADPVVFDSAHDEKISRIFLLALSEQPDLLKSILLSR